jgi:hypothetical protein
MAACCEHDACCAPQPQPDNTAYRRVLWAVLALNTPCSSSKWPPD